MDDDEDNIIMEASKQIQLFHEFIEENYLEDLLETSRKGKHSLIMDYNQLGRFNPQLAELLLESPEDVLKAAELSLENFDTPNDTEKIKVRFSNLPESSTIGIGEIRHKNLGKLSQFEGLIVKVGDVRTIPDSSRYECRSCGNILQVLQLNADNIKEPTKCGCSGKRFTLLSREWKNIQHIIVEEYITDYTQKKARPTTMRVILEYDLTTEKLTKKLQPGKHVKFTGIVEAKPIRTTNKGTSAYHEFQISCNYIKVEDISLFNLKVPNGYVEEFKKLKGDANLISNISESIFWGIEGMEKIKEILTVSRARGVKTYHQDGKLDQRDTINVFMIGNPGSAKSEMAKMAVKVDIINMMVSGKGVSGVGLTSSTTHDKELGCWCIEPGAVPRCDKGSIVIDEIDKIEDKDTSALNEAMVNLSFMTVKANQQVTLHSDVGIIGCANPDGRKFDGMIDKYSQITLKPDFLDRFDIWVAVDKIVETSAQKKVISKIISRFKREENKPRGKYDLKWLQYYYAWVIQTFQPEINEAIEEYTTEEISKMMNKTGQKNSDISYRLVGNIIRFSIAIARLLQSDSVEKEHVVRALDMQKYAFKSLDMLDEQGNISEEKLQFETPVETKRKKYALIDLIKERYKETSASLTTDEIKKIWEDEGNDPEDIDDLLEKLIRRSDIFEPRRNEWRPI